MVAATEGYTDTTRILLDSGADVNAKDNIGWTALLCAAFSNQTETVRALVAKGAEVNARDAEGRSALFWASFSGHADVVRVLLDHGAHINDRDNYGWTPLMSAVDLGHVDAAKVLLDKGADVQARTKDGSSALRLAEKYKYYSLVALLKPASHEPPPKAPVPESNSNLVSGSTPAPAPLKATEKPVEPAQTIPPASTPLASKSDTLNQELLDSAEAGDTSEVLSLIRDGAGVNARGLPYGDTALMRASARGHIDTVRALLEKGGEVDARDSAGRTALMDAASEGYTDTAKLLLEKGATINSQDKEGWTPLFWAAYSRRTETVRFLLSKGADVNAVNKYQDTALIRAAYGGDTDTVAALLENHANVNQRDDMGRTALIEASRQGHLETARMLVERGASIDVQANDGSTALSLAEKLHYPEIASLLKEKRQIPASSDDAQVSASEAPSESLPPVAPQNTSQSSNGEPIPPALAPDASPAKQEPSANPVASAVQAIQKKTQAQAFYRMGLSMRLIEDYWPQNNRVAERAADSILGDLNAAGAPDDLVLRAQKVSAQLSAPLQERKGSVAGIITDLHDHLNAYCLRQQGQSFFYNAGGFTYDMNTLGQEVARSGQAPTQVEQKRTGLSSFATSLASQCAAIADCKVRALSYITDATSLLHQSPLQAADGTTLQKLSDQISVALGTDEPLTSY